MRFGCHVSIKEGYLGAAIQAKKLRAEAFQYFPKNPRSLSVKAFHQSDASACKEFCLENGLVSVSHTPYPTTITPTDNKRNAVIESLYNDLEISEACGSIGVVVHFGKLRNRHDPLASYHLMIDVLNEVLEHWEGDCKILLENNAGKPGSIGTTIEELAQVRKLTNYPEKIGFCLDTCHAYASSLWDGTNWGEVRAVGLKQDYLQHLKVIHLNNSKFPAGSGKDRHANIFEDGYIEETQFSDLMKCMELQHTPFILETPSVISKEIEISRLYQTWGT
ncbi:deoxyribonuclease IV [Salirhabdus salicampi]|uniref:deoxyribonuclease IV n=1 Tax=Salirhabdus salicampi TaxID=476102 RepID=UPI0020C324B4|nr:deoxyribonuclease IV [Salirhabdus salicampi]MCP8616215.1 deoxyribonuclease IV [Salirhabdus salicampi]